MTQRTEGTQIIELAMSVDEAGYVIQTLRRRAAQLRRRKTVEPSSTVAEAAGTIAVCDRAVEALERQIREPDLIGPRIPVEPFTAGGDA